MKLIRNILLLSAIFACGEVFAQTDSAYQPVSEIPYPVSCFLVNPTGELYIITPGNQLKKYGPSGDSIGVFNNVKNYGQLSYVAGQNPWKTLLFYEGFQTIVMLDNYLSVTGTIQLANQNIFKVRAITSSYDNHIWVFDEGDFKIKKIDDNGNLLSASVDLRQVMDDIPHPEKIIDNDGLLYLYDPDRGIFVFDYYGSFKIRLPFLHWKNLFIVDKTIYGFDDTKMYAYKSPQPLPAETILPSSFQNATQIGFSGQKIYVLKNGTLKVYHQP
ncbi:MAG: hypothetical protein J0H55_04710 [Chitinophagaceae bacterium]|nr:hypothetical protein [Chitinophagaceae bacterium]